MSDTVLNAFQCILIYSGTQTYVYWVYAHSLLAVTVKLFFILSSEKWGRGFQNGSSLRQKSISSYKLVTELQYFLSCLYPNTISSKTKIARFNFTM